jgi:hypothetical protein
MDILVLILVLLGVYVIGARVIWWTTKKDWDRYEKHECGHFSWMRRCKPCPKCGESNDNWQSVHARAHLFRGWEWKEPTR